MMSHTEHEDESTMEDYEKKARNLYSAYAGEEELTLHWDLLDCNKCSECKAGEIAKECAEENLVRIFYFFGRMAFLSSEDASKTLKKYLRKRLRDRFKEDKNPKRSFFGERQKPNIGSELESIVEELSKYQVIEFKTLQNHGLLEAAFELFVTGSLTSDHIQSHPELHFANDAVGRDDVITPEAVPGVQPNGSDFFLWAEFALLACELRYNEKEWMGYLPILFRAGRIYGLSYSKNDENVPLTLGFFNHDTFKPISPEVARAIPRPRAGTLSDFELEATRIAHNVFPGELSD